MNPLINCIWILFISKISAQQTQYLLYQENVTVSYVDPTYADISIQIYPFNKSVNALNITATAKRDMSENIKLQITAYRWHRTDYKFRVLHLAKSVSDAMQMDTFGLELLCLEYFRPPLVWPIKKGVTYRSFRWSPDSSRFPPNLPEGHYKIHLSYEDANKTEIGAADWFVKIVYKK